MTGDHYASAETVGDFVSRLNEDFAAHGEFTLLGTVENYARIDGADAAVGFDLRGEQACVRCYFPRGQKAPYRPSVGHRVVVAGELRFVPGRGRLQFVVRSAAPAPR